MKKVDDIFRYFFIKNKKILFYLPIIAIGLLCSAFYLKRNSTISYEEPNLDISLPNSETKELSDNKLEVLDLFEEHDSKSKSDSNKDYDLLKNTDNDFLSVESKNTPDASDKEVLSNVDNMLKQMDNTKKLEITHSSKYESKKTSNNEENIVSHIKNKDKNINIESEDEENEENESNNITSWVNPKFKNNTYDTRVYKAAIVSTRKKYITPKNNRVQIRLMESFNINGIEIPITTQLVAYAEFQNDLKLTIKSIMIENKVIPVNISVLDSQGQDAIEIIGGTGAEIEREMTDEAIASNKIGNNLIDKAVSVVSGKRKPKAIISADYVYLKINK